MRPPRARTVTPIFLWRTRARPRKIKMQQILRRTLRLRKIKMQQILRRSPRRRVIKMQLMQFQTLSPRPARMLPPRNKPVLVLSVCGDLRNLRPPRLKPIPPRVNRGSARAPPPRVSKKRLRHMAPTLALKPVAIIFKCPVWRLDTAATRRPTASFVSRLRCMRHGCFLTLADVTPTPIARAPNLRPQTCRMIAPFNAWWLKCSARILNWSPRLVCAPRRSKMLWPRAAC